MIGTVIPASTDWPHGARDLTAHSPVALRKRMREPSEVRCIVWHQTAFERRPDNPRWALVAGHAVVLRTSVQGAGRHATFNRGDRRAAVRSPV